MFDIFPARDRKSVRRAVDARCEAVADRGFRWLGRTLRDLSPEGAFLATDAELELGEEVYLAFQAPRTRLWIDACARVVRRVGGAGEGEERGVGLRFEALDPADRAVLEATLERLPPPVPARPPRRDYASALLALALG
jgi:hypothetical protein